jgi:regulator of protease activity HflC (stomatin/prohibitin superfamily)
LVDGIQGRQEDVLDFLEADGNVVSVHPNVFHQVMDTVSATGWQVIQDETNGIQLLISGASPNSMVATQLQDTLRRALGDLGVSVSTIRVEWVDSIPRTSNGKAPLIVSRPNHHT